MSSNFHTTLLSRCMYRKVTEARWIKYHAQSFIANKAANAQTSALSALLYYLLQNKNNREFNSFPPV